LWRIKLMAMDILYSSLYQIDHSNGLRQSINIGDSGEILTQYTNRLLDQIYKSGNRRSFIFRSDNTEVRAAIQRILENVDVAEAAEINVDRLLAVEADAQEEHKHLDMEIPKGSLFQTLIEDDNEKKIIISKADHNEFVDDEDFQLHKGLPWKKRIYKAAMVVFDQNNQVSSVFVYDTGSKISTYWWKHYLELSELYTNEHNTSRSLEIMDNKVFGKIKEDFPADHFLLRNSTVGFYKSNEEFDLGVYLDTIWNGYDPVDEGFDKEKWISKLLELPDKWSFDPKFDIVKSEVNKRMLSKVALNEGLDLVIKDHIENIEDTITAELDREGNKFIKIRTDTGYEKFKKRDQ